MVNMQTTIYKKLFLSSLLFAFLFCLALPLMAAAQTPCIDPGAPCITSFNVVLVNILRFVWVIFTVIAVICFVVSGVLFLTAQGDPAKIKIARTSVIWGTAGIVIGIVAFSVIRIIESVFT